MILMCMIMIAVILSDLLKKLGQLIDISLMREVRCGRFNLASFYLPVAEGCKMRICVATTKDKTMGFIHIA